MRLKFTAMAMPLVLTAVAVMASVVVPFRSTTADVEGARRDVQATLAAERFARARAEIVWHVVRTVVTGEMDAGQPTRARAEAEEARQQWIASAAGSQRRVAIRMLGERVDRADELADRALELVGQGGGGASALEELVTFSNEVGVGIDRYVTLSHHELREAMVTLAGGSGSSLPGLDASLGARVAGVNLTVEGLLAGSEYLRWMNVIPSLLGRLVVLPDAELGGVVTFYALAVNELQNWQALAHHHSEPVEDGRLRALDELVSEGEHLLRMAASVVSAAEEGWLDEAKSLFMASYVPALEPHLAGTQAVIESYEAEVLGGISAVAAGSRQAQVTSLGAAGLLLLVALAMVFAARRMSRRVRRIEEAATAVGLGDLSTRVPVDSTDELASLAASLNTMTTRLRKEHERSAELMQRTVDAAERERMRLAADLHDGPVQRLTGLVYKIERDSLRESEGSANGTLEEARATVAGEIRRLRNLMAELRPPALDELGLPRAVEEYVLALSDRAGMSGRVEMVQSPKLSLAAETTIYRVVQEALTNVAKHAAASVISVRAWEAEGEYVVTVTDDGKGFDVAKAQSTESEEQFGLVGMRERVAIAGGRLVVESAWGTGSVVTMRFPLEVVRHD